MGPKFCTDGAENILESEHYFDAGVGVLQNDTT